MVKICVYFYLTLKWFLVWGVAFLRCPLTVSETYNAMYVDTRMWGLLGKGRIEYWLPPEVVDEKGRKNSANMSGDMYEKLVKRSFKA